MICKIPYGRSQVNAEIPDQNFLYYAQPVALPEMPDPVVVTEDAFAHPIGCEKLEDLVTSEMKIAILIDDITRPTPKKFLLPYVLKRLEQKNIPYGNIKLVLGLGTHRQLTQSELDKTIGLDILERYTLLNLDYKDKRQFVSMGKSESGIPIEVYREVIESDFKIAIGNIVPHIAAGWGGGAKMIQPGVCSEATTEITHLIACTKQNVLEVCGNVDNLCRQEMEKIAGQVGLDFIVNTVMDEGKNILGVFCGDFIQAHRAGVALAKKVMCPEIPKQADIVIASANPAHIDFWQGCKPYVFSQFGVREGGTLIFLIDAPEGLCGNAFHHEQTLIKYCSMEFEEICCAVDRGDVKDIVGVNVPLFLASIAGRTHTIMVSQGMNREHAAYLGFDYAENIEEALAMAFLEQGENASVGVIPYAGETLVRFPL